MENKALKLKYLGFSNIENLQIEYSTALNFNNFFEILKA